jgi:hypothetical protein
MLAAITSCQNAILMKQTAILIIIIALSLPGCGPSQHEKNLQKEQLEIKQKEQQLFVWEQRLKMREQELNNAKQVLDSVQFDTANNPLIIGKWIVKMTCAQTTCDGSAIGDTKTEQWDIQYNGENVVVKAYSGPVLIRVYTGSYQNKVLKIVDEKPNSKALISANLNFINGNRMDGLREISQKDCKIVYELSLEKSQ